MNQKKARKLAIELARQKDEDLAAILYTKSVIAKTDGEKMNLVYKAAMLVKDINCEKRVWIYKAAVRHSVQLKQWKNAHSFATIALIFNEESELFYEIAKKYQGMENEKIEESEG